MNLHEICSSKSNAGGPRHEVRFWKSLLFQNERVEEALADSPLGLKV